MTGDGLLTALVFLMVTSATLLVYTLVAGRRSRLDERLETLEHDPLGELPGQTPARGSLGAASSFTTTTLPKMGQALMPTDEAERTLLRTRLIHAGFYGRQAMPVFLGVKLLLMLVPVGIGIALGTLGLVPMSYGLMGGAWSSILGMIGPSFWLDSRKAKRQVAFRRALPDALDVLVICLEGGLSLPGSLKRVASELGTAHPTLARELNLVQREMQLGRVPGEALQQMGIRTDLEEVRSLASVVTQAERFGASLVKSLRVHAETLRQKRQQQAEEMAQKAGTKILFPTVLLIFPAIFVVILGPAAYQIMEVFENMK